MLELCCIQFVMYNTIAVENKINKMKQQLQAGKFKYVRNIDRERESTQEIFIHD